jgi:hypothetical protein
MGCWHIGQRTKLFPQSLQVCELCMLAISIYNAKIVQRKVRETFLHLMSASKCKILRFIHTYGTCLQAQKFQAYFLFCQGLKDHAVSTNFAGLQKLSITKEGLYYMLCMGPQDPSVCIKVQKEAKLLNCYIWLIN